MAEGNEEVQETQDGEQGSEQEPSAQAQEEVTPAVESETPASEETATPDETTAPDETAAPDERRAEAVEETAAAGEEEVEAPSEEAAPPPEEEAPPRELVELASEARYFATGKRKSAVARVIVRPGNGAFDLNGRSLEVYFPRPRHQSVVRQPLEATGYLERVDIRARIHGGGISGQAGAVRHGIAKALIEVDPNLRGELKRRQFLTRDPRVKERRKAGLKKARKRPQFSKR